MKTRNIFLALIATALSGVMVSCDDFLDREPTSQLAPETFLRMPHTYRLMRISIIPVFCLEIPVTPMVFYANDQGTDNQIAANAPSYFCTGEWKVPNASGDWSFTTIYHLNFFFASVLPLIW